MKCKLFKKQVEKEILIELLNNICDDKNESKYLVNNAAYKKGIMFNHIQSFYNKLTEYYHVSKQYYVTRKTTYKSFITILRQLCKYFDVTYLSQIKYIKSNYEIMYHIDMTASLDSSTSGNDD
jgi:hypothetical protein